MKKGRSFALRPGAIPAVTAAGYLLAATAWIYFSDGLAHALAGSVDDLIRFETAKGVFFVAATSLALYAWLRSRAHALREARLQLEALNRDLECRIEERTAELVATNKALESFTYSVAHDLRSPVAHVDGFARALVESLTCGEPECERARHYSQRIAANAKQMSEMIEGMLQVSRAERMAIERQAVDMTSLATDVLADIVAERAAFVAIESLPGVAADPRLLRQVWSNLLSNAVKYSAQAQAPCVKVTGRALAGEVIYCVEDNGVGFDPAEAERLFNAFQRLSNARSFAGSGVGLAIVKRIVERHGGRVWADGQPGLGARFSFALPA